MTNVETLYFHSNSECLLSMPYIIVILVYAFMLSCVGASGFLFLVLLMSFYWSTFSSNFFNKKDA